MAEILQDIVVALAPQPSQGNPNVALDGVLPGGPIGTDEGLLLGDAGSGINESGLTLSLERIFEERPRIGEASRPISSFIRRSAPTFTMAFPFVGNRANAVTPAVGELQPIPAIDAVLNAAGLVGATDTGPIHYSYTFDLVNAAFMHAAVWYNGQLIEFLDCRNTLSIDFTPGVTPVATATITIGSIRSHAIQAAPASVTYGNQLVTAPILESANHTWGALRGFSAFTLDIAPEFTDTPDSNAVNGFRTALSNRVTTFNGTMWTDDTNPGPPDMRSFDYDQLGAEDIAAMSPLTFEYGTDATIGEPIEAVHVKIPQPELRVSDLNVLDARGATDVTGVATADGSTVAAGEELDIGFR